MKSIVRRDARERYTDYLKWLAAAEGIQAGDGASLRRMDRKHRRPLSMYLITWAPGGPTVKTRGLVAPSRTTQVDKGPVSAVSTREVPPESGSGKFGTKRRARTRLHAAVVWATRYFNAYGFPIETPTRAELSLMAKPGRAHLARSDVDRRP